MSGMGGTRDHGGNLDAAMATFGGGAGDWLDLSTGINPTPCPVPELPPDAWARLPGQSDILRLQAAAGKAYAAQVPVVPVAGAQAAIQLVPRLRSLGRAVVLSPTYNEHAAAFRTAGWQVEAAGDLAALKGADAAVVVNPNNPDGRRHRSDALLALSAQVKLLIVDESFADPEPDLSLAPHLGGAADNVLVLRSFGKFYGLAGLRLGFALAAGDLAARVRDLAGPWAVSGPAIEIGAQALADVAWRDKMISCLGDKAARLDTLAEAAGWGVVGGTPLFRTYATPNAEQAQRALAEHRVWPRIFPYSKTWLRLGLPPDTGWEQVQRAIAATP